MTAPPNRLPGYDLARFLAIFGVVVIDMVLHVAMDPNGYGMIADGPKPLMWMYQMWWGRASAMLAVLAGTGLALMFKPSDSAIDRARKRRVILRRALFLLVVGHLWNSSTLWSFSILHSYAFFLAFGMLFVSARPWLLLTSAFATVSVSMVLLLAVGDSFEDSDTTTQGPPPAVAGEMPPSGGEPMTDTDFSFGPPHIWDARFWDPSIQFMDTFVDGMYPLFPWLAFVLFGMWVVRIGVNRPEVRMRVLVGSIIVLAASLSTWWMLESVSNPTIRTLAGIGRIPPTPLYVLSSAAQAIILLCLCLLVASRPSFGRWSAPLIATGQMTFTIYIAHILIGGGDRMGLFDIIGFPPGDGLVDGWIRVALFFTLTIVTCHFWKRRFQRGPLEAVMRWFSDR